MAKVVFGTQSDGSPGENNRLPQANRFLFLKNVEGTGVKFLWYQNATNGGFFDDNRQDR